MSNIILVRNEEGGQRFGWRIDAKRRIIIVRNEYASIVIVIESFERIVTLMFETGERVDRGAVEYLICAVVRFQSGSYSFFLVGKY